MCTSDGQWSNPCAATSVEVCDTDQLDEDCDGLVNEPDVCNTPPRVAITLPSQDLGATNDTAYDGMDSELGLWYVDIRVAATAMDPEDGDLSGTNLRWYTNRSDIHPEAFLGTGATTTVRLYSNDCFGVIHELRVEATDSFGATTVSSPRQITIWTLC